jgi:hypothetical protein
MAAAVEGTDTHTDGFIASFLGAVAGGAALGLVGLIIGVRFAEATERGFDEIGAALTYASWGLFVGAWVGATVGTWWALRARGHRNAGATAAALATMLAVGVVLWETVLLDGGDLIAITLPLVALCAAPIVARALTRP